MPEDQRSIPDSESGKQPRKKRPRTTKRLKTVDGITYEKVSKLRGGKDDEANSRP